MKQNLTPGWGQQAHEGCCVILVHKYWMLLIRTTQIQDRARWCHPDTGTAGRGQSHFARSEIASSSGRMVDFMLM